MVKNDFQCEFLCYVICTVDRVHLYSVFLAQFLQQVWVLQRGFFEDYDWTG